MSDDDTTINRHRIEPNYPVPEAVRQDGRDWDVKGKPAGAGETKLDRKPDGTHVMAAPTGPTEQDRVLRLKEMGKAKWSPPRLKPSAGTPQEYAQQAEEARVNNLLGQEFGYDRLQDLPDLIGLDNETVIERMASATRTAPGDLAALLLSQNGTPTYKKMADMLREKDPEMGAAIVMATATAAGKLQDDRGQYTVPCAMAAADYLAGAFPPDAEPGDYADGGVIAETMQQFADMEAMAETMEHFDWRESKATTKNQAGAKTEGGDGIGSMSATEGVIWTKPTVITPPRPDSLPPAMRVKSRRSPRRMGASVRNVSRVLTDGRPFTTRRREPGAVVLIDMSGSMHVSAEDVRAMMSAMPGAIIGGYAASEEAAMLCREVHGEHSPQFQQMQQQVGDYAEEGGKSHITIMGKDSRQISLEHMQLATGGGNECDLPALMWAVAQRPTNKAPIYWISDGQVIPGGGGNGGNAVREVTAYCRHHHILRLDEAGALLARTEAQIKGLAEVGANSILKNGYYS